MPYPGYMRKSRRKPALRGSLKKKKRRRRSTRHVAKSAAIITIAKGRIVMLLPKRLKSLNSRGGHWEEAGERRAWEEMIATASVITDGSVKGPAVGRRRLAIVRLAPSRRYLLDKTNLDACGKRLEDALVALGYLIDDDRFGVDGPFITQAVSADIYYWVVLTLADAPPYVDDVQVVNAAVLAASSLAP